MSATMMEIKNMILLLLLSPILVTAEDDPFFHMLHPEIDGEAISIVNPDVSTIVFTLYTRQNAIKGHVIRLNDADTIQSSRWNTSRSTAIIIHGWNADDTEGASATIRDAMLKAADIDVITVNWGKIARNIVYSTVAADVPHVANHVATFINFMHANGNLTNSNLKLIGHSLGAHVAGLAAGAVKQYGLVSEVVALDPAGPLFLLKGPDGRVDKSQAQNVQVIHTTAGKLGLAFSIGTSDFYANDGTNQPGCGLDVSGACGHSRSYKYFSESLTNPRGFLGTPDGSNEAAYMGGVTLDPNAQGDYHFKTNSSAPYATSD